VSLEVVAVLNIFRRSLCILALVTLPGVMLGCINFNTEIHVTDTDSLTPSGRISCEVWPGNATRRSGTALDLITGKSTDATMQSIGIQGTLSVDGEVAAVNGQDHQNVTLGDEIEISHVEFPGPARVKANSENLRGQIAGRGGIRFYDVLSLEAILGLGVDDTEVQVRDGATGIDATDEELRAGLVIGGRATVRPIALFDVYAQYTANLAGEALLAAVIEDSQIGVELNLMRNFAIYSGYRWWSYQESVSGDDSEWDLDVRGPTVGASIKF
jgi:hypothetical protein